MQQDKTRTSLYRGDGQILGYISLYKRNRDEEEVRQGP